MMDVNLQLAHLGAIAKLLTDHKIATALCDESLVEFRDRPPAGRGGTTEIQIASYKITIAFDCANAVVALNLNYTHQYREGREEWIDGRNYIDLTMPDSYQRILKLIKLHHRIHDRIQQLKSNEYRGEDGGDGTVVVALDEIPF